MGWRARQGQGDHGPGEVTGSWRRWKDGEQTDAHADWQTDWGGGPTSRRRTRGQERQQDRGTSNQGMSGRAGGGGDAGQTGGPADGRVGGPTHGKKRQGRGRPGK